MQSDFRDQRAIDRDERNWAMRKKGWLPPGEVRTLKNKVVHMRAIVDAAEAYVLADTCGAIPCGCEDVPDHTELWAAVDNWVQSKKKHSDDCPGCDYCLFDDPTP